MRRRLIVIGLGVLALGLLLATYLIGVHGRPNPLTRRPEEGGKTPAGEGKALEEFVAHPGKEPVVYIYDENHRLQTVYRAKLWQPVGDKVQLLQPRVTYYLKGGEEVVIEADEGLVTAQRVGGDVNVREGELRGDVWIWFDRGTEPGRSPMVARPKDTLRIHVDSMRFDNDALELTSDGYVSLFAKEADVLGRGLKIAWSESPRELRELRILRGEYMCVREGQESFVSDALLPGGVDTPGESTGTEERSRLDVDRGDPGGLPAMALAMVRASLAGTETIVYPAPPPDLPTGTATLPPPVVTPPAPPVTTTTAPPEATSTAPPAGTETTAAPTTAPALATATAPPAPTPTVPPGPPPVVKETYETTLTDDVMVISGRRRIRGAEELRLVFQFSRPDRRQETEEPEPEEVFAASRPAGRPADEASEPEPEGPAPDPLFVIWRGPLVMKPFRSHRGYKTPASAPAGKVNRFDVYGRGERIELSDGGSMGVCKAFEVHSPEQRGKLEGAADEPVVLTLPTGERVSCELVRFDLEGRIINLDGAGEMRLPSGTETAVRRRDEPVATATGDSDRRRLGIRWTKSVELAFDRQQITVEGERRRREFLKTARFVGDIKAAQAATQNLQAGELLVKFKQPLTLDDKLNQAESIHASGGVRLEDVERGDYINADTLDVDMVRTADGKTVPSEARASGTVTAKQEDTEIAADALGVTFEYGPDPKSDTREVRLRPTQLNAAGHVKITDRRDPDEPIVAEAQSLETDIDARTATLTGDLAKVTQKGNTVESEEIFLDQAAERATATGRGKLRFYSDTDISGNKTDRPRPIDIAWAKGMDYQGLKRRAVITGDVNLVTAGDTMGCETLTVDFEPREKDVEAQPTTRPADEVKTERERFRAQRITRVRAERDVRLESVRKDDGGFLLRRILLKSPKRLTYDPKARLLACAGPGTLSIEDYRPPEAKQAARDRGDVMEVGSTARPSQSAFEWTDSMQMDQTQRLVQLVGNVKLAHRSGQQVLLSKRLTIRPYRKELPDGRKTMLACDELLAKFSKPDDAVAEDSDPLGGPRVGGLVLFDAKGRKSDVNLLDGPRQVLCRAVVYSRANDTAVIYGSLPGDLPKDAVLYYTNPKTGRLMTWKSPKLTWYRRTNRVEASDVRGGGSL